MGKAGPIPSPQPGAGQTGVTSLAGTGTDSWNGVLGCKQGGGNPRGSGKDRGAGDALRALAVVTGSSLCAHSDKGRCVCKHPACSYKSDLRSMTEHLEVMIWWGNYLMLLFSPISPPFLGSTYFDCESNIMCLCLKEETPWVYVCCLDSLHIKACDSRSSLSSWDRQYQQKQH